MNLNSFAQARLRGGFCILHVEVAREPLVDALGREAIAKTQIVGREIRIVVRPDLDEKELSVTLYHEVLEAMTVAVIRPPDRVIDFNEGDFEREGYAAFDQLGLATPDTLNRMLQFF